MVIVTSTVQYEMSQTVYFFAESTVYSNLCNRLERLREATTPRKLLRKQKAERGALRREGPVERRRASPIAVGAGRAFGDEASGPHRFILGIVLS